MNKKITTQFAIIFLLVNCSNQSTDFSYPDYRKDYLSETIGIKKRLDWTEKKFFVVETSSVHLH